MKHGQRTTHRSQISVASWSHCTRSPASICVKSSLSFLADLRGYYLHPSAYLQSAPICVKSSSFLADLRGLSLRPSAWNLLFLSRWFTLICAAPICLKSSFLFSLIYADFLCLHLRIFNLRLSAWNLLFLFSLIYADFICVYLREIISFLLADLRWFVLRPYAWSHL